MCKQTPCQTQEPKEHHKRTQELMKQIMSNKRSQSKTTHERKLYKIQRESEINQSTNTKA
jgi:ethanolamine utilization protein EutQ (cupin superfamily)